MIDLRELLVFAKTESSTVDADRPQLRPYIRLRIGRSLSSASVGTRWELTAATDWDALERLIRAEAEATDERRVWVQLVPAGSETAKCTTRLMFDGEQRDGVEDSDGSLRGVVSSLCDAVIRMTDTQTRVYGELRTHAVKLESDRLHQTAQLAAMFARAEGDPKSLELQVRLGQLGLLEKVIPQGFAALRAGMAGAGAPQDLAAQIKAAGDIILDKIKSGTLTPEEQAALLALFAQVRAASGVQDPPKPDASKPDDLAAK